ncbi:MAG TPA: restriction endonuclease subunit S [Clostridiaceae bacterium]|nr:restriction endonuclease subunit S [Clostridiaceae bacterium]
MQFNKIKLKDIADINMGQSPSGSSYNNNGRGIPFLQGNKTFGFLYPTIDTWTTEPKKIGKRNSVLMSVRAPVGDLNIANKDICIGRGLCSIEMKNGNNQYLYYLLKNSIKKIKMKSTGTVFDSINRKELENIEILDFNKSQQKKISKVLFDIDKKIELNTQTNDNLLKIGLELLKEDFNKKTEYEVLSNVIKFVKGKKPSDITHELKEGYKKYLTIACLNGQEVNYADPTKMVLANNDLLMVMDGASSGEVYYGGQGLVGSTLSRVDCIDGKYISEFIYFIMKYYKDLIQSKNTGSAIPHTDRVFVGNLKVPKLLIDEQEKYKILLHKILQNINENETLEQLRDTLLPKLMNGEIDLDKIEI